MYGVRLLAPGRVGRWHAARHSVWVHTRCGKPSEWYAVPLAGERIDVSPASRPHCWAAVCWPRRTAPWLCSGARAKSAISTKPGSTDACADPCSRRMCYVAGTAVDRYVRGAPCSVVVSYGGRACTQLQVLRSADLSCRPLRICVLLPSISEPAGAFDKGILW